ncbi:MAG: hypothetical protein L0271_00155 [Gemmatimonadetes bacterium]|nr:hypothetical protein [Gemmatimonadota bacterium]
MERVGRRDWITRLEFHARLVRWFRESDEPVVGDPDAHRRTTWIWIRDGHRLARLYADTTRESVAAYLNLLGSARGDLSWTVVESAAGHLTKVAFGPDQTILDGFHLYIDPRTLPRAI